MKLSKTFILTLIPLLIVILIDQLTKEWAKSLEYPFVWGIFEFKLAYNNGFILGYFSELPQMAKGATFITLGTFTLICYFFFIFLVPIKSKMIFLGSSLLIGGVVGNVLDRFSAEGVVDFISFNFIENSPIMNIADMIQWIGYILLAVGFYQDARYYWPKIELRNKFLVNNSFQIRTAFFFSVLTFLSTVLLIVFSYSFLSTYQTENTLNSFLFVGFLISITLSFIIFIITIYISHRVAGPMKAFQRHLKLTIQGEEAYLKLRENDEFKEMADDLNQLNEKLQDHKKQS